jgi:1,5-anhydro-D-fructose reductase (1,5-anhydro-D-mannitol-forming)
MSGLRWGLIGASDIAASRMIPSMQRCGDDVVAVMSSSAERGRNYAQAHEIPSAYDDCDALLARDDVDAVYISTTNELHVDQTLAAAAAGKHILCEKPLALSVTDAETMVSGCERAGVVLATNHHLPAAGTHRAIRDLVASGTIGKPLAVRVFHAVSLPERLRGWRLTEPGRGGGVVLDITCHSASAVRHILGSEAVEATALGVSQGDWETHVKDAVVTGLRFDGDVLVQTHDAFTVTYAGTGLEVHGSEGSVIATDVMTQDPIGTVMLRDRRGEREVPVADRRDLYDITLTAFASAVRGEGQPIVDGIGGMRSLAVALAVQESSDTGRAVPVAGHTLTSSTAQ